MEEWEFVGQKMGEATPGKKGGEWEADWNISGPRRVPGSYSKNGRPLSQHMSLFRKPCPSQHLLGSCKWVLTFPRVPAASLCLSFQIFIVSCKLRVTEPGKSLQSALHEQLVAPQNMRESQNDTDGREVRGYWAQAPHSSGEGLKGNWIPKSPMWSQWHSLSWKLFFLMTCVAFSLKPFEAIPAATSQEQDIILLIFAPLLTITALHFYSTSHKNK